MFRLKFLGAAGVLALTIGSANAALITDHVTFSAAGFTAFPVGGVPTEDPVMGAFNITFDPTQVYNTDTTTGITLTSLNITAGSAISFCYSAAAYTCDGLSWSADELVVGGIASDTSRVQYSPATDDYVLQISNFTSSPVFTEMVYAQLSAGNYQFYTTPLSTGSITVTPVTATPLPAALPLFATGVGALGLFGWRRKRKNAAAIVSA